MSLSASSKQSEVKQLKTGNLTGKKVTVVGLGRFGGGIGVTRWLCSQGAKVTVSDSSKPDALQDSLKQLEGLQVTLHLGGHEKDDFLNADLLVVNPAVPKEMPLIREAQAAGIARTSEINIFIERCPAPIVGITGSVGKSTTSAMTGDVLSQKYTVHIGGNIGKSLLNELPDIKPNHIVVLELSSFQLEDLPIIQISPQVALVTNLKPNHLDRHGNLEAYGEAKKNIFRFQSQDDLLILNSKCKKTSAWKSDTPGKVKFFDPDAELFELIIPGKYNQANAQATWAVAKEFGIERQVAAQTLKKFKGLHHRLQFVVEKDGIRYYNDSKCTTPEGAIVALESFEPQSSIIILGGYDKSVSFDDLAKTLVNRAKVIITLGETSENISDAVRKYLKTDSPILESAKDLPKAVQLSRKYATKGDVVLLSPACASYDMFSNYEQRGDTFTKLVTL